MKILVSACLLGVNCKYSQENNKCAKVKNLVGKHQLIPVCPEIMGGLTTPRMPAEIFENKVVTQDGQDVTEQFQRGAEETLKLAKLFGCTYAILKERSPSCGCGIIYDGTFSKKLKQGDGLTAKLLKEHGIQIIGETEEEKIDQIKNQE